MNLIRLLTKMTFLSEAFRLQLYPPFWFMGVKVREIAADYRSARLHLPIRWYGRNTYGSMFGGFISAVSDPLPVLMVERIFPGTQAWTRKLKVEFLKPARSGLDIEIGMAQEEVEMIGSTLEQKGECTFTLVFPFKDRRGREVARVHNTVFIRSIQKD